MKKLLLLFVVCALAAFAADITGTWKGTAEGPNGALERTFVFKQNGTALTGKTVSSMFGESAIENGKVEGDAVSFTVTIKFNDNDMKVSYTGKVQGDTMKLTAEAGGNTFEWTAKKST